METSEEKRCPSLTIVAPQLKLSKLQTRAIFTNILQTPVPAETDPLPHTSLFLLFVADMLERIGGLQSEQRQLLLTEVHASGLADLPGLRQLVVIDGTYCTWTGQSNFLVLDTGETIQTLPNPPLETIGYNLNELWRRGISLVEKSAAHVKKNTAGSVEKS